MWNFIRRLLGWGNGSLITELSKPSEALILCRKYLYSQSNEKGDRLICVALHRAAVGREISVDLCRVTCAIVMEAIRPHRQLLSHYFDEYASNRFIIVTHVTSNYVAYRDEWLTGLIRRLQKEGR
jgi:hypothetical protein